jgi:hypothetical protein
MRAWQAREGWSWDEGESEGEGEDRERLVRGLHAVRVRVKVQAP